MKLVTKAEFVQIWKEAEKKGINQRQSTATAGIKAAHIIADYFSSLANQTVLGLIGKGNKGLCTLSALIELRKHGWLTTAYLVDYPTSDPVLKHYKQIDGEILKIAKDPSLNVLRQAIADNSVLIDGLITPFGAPSDKTLRVMKTASSEVRQIGRYVVSLGMPSGIDAETGAISENALAADLTIIAGVAGIGLAKPEALRLAGQVAYVPLGIEELEAWHSINHHLVDEKMVKAALRKADFAADTSILLAIGSVNHAGRPLLAGKAALRSGAAQITIGIPNNLHTSLATALPEADWVLLPHELGVINEDAADVLKATLEEKPFNACLLGVDTTSEEATTRFWQQMLGETKHSGSLGFVPTAQKKRSRTHLPPLVLGQNGAQALEKLGKTGEFLPTSTVILAGTAPDEGEEPPEQRGTRLAQKWGRAVVVWGELPIVACPDGKTGAIPYPLPRTHFAGSEAVLGGITASFLAHGLTAWEAATAAAWIYAAALNRASQQTGWLMGTTANDALPQVPNIIAEFA